MIPTPEMLNVNMSLKVSDLDNLLLTFVPSNSLLAEESDIVGKTAGVVTRAFSFGQKGGINNLDPNIEAVNAEKTNDGMHIDFRIGNKTERVTFKDAPYFVKIYSKAMEDKQFETYKVTKGDIQGHTEVFGQEYDLVKKHFNKIDPNAFANTVADAVAKRANNNIANAKKAHEQVTQTQSEQLSLNLDGLQEQKGLAK